MFEKWAPYLQSAVVFGRGRLLDDSEETLVLTRKIAEKYYPGKELIEEEIRRSGKAVQVYEISIEHLSGKEIQEK